MPGSKRKRPALKPGDKFGRWTYISASSTSGKAIFLCDCGTKKEVDISSVVHGKSQSCGCKPRERQRERKVKHAQSMIGKRYGRLTVTGIADIEAEDTIFDCVCECGKTCQVTGTRLRHGATKSCGCLGPEKSKKRSIEIMRKNGKTSYKRYGFDGTMVNHLYSKTPVNSTTGIRGVSLRKGKYRAYINLKGKNYYLGAYASKLFAAKVRRSAEKILFDETLDEWEKIRSLEEKVAFYKNKALQSTKRAQPLEPGDRFGHLVFVGSGTKPRCGRFECDCGNTVEINITSVRRGCITSCGCVPPEKRPTFPRNPDDCIGMRSGKLTVIGVNREGKYTKFICQCDCGNVTETLPQSFRSGHTRSCGCIANNRSKRKAYKPKYRRPEDSIGERFGRGVVIGVDRETGKKPKFILQCDCGKIYRANPASVRNGNTKSCGCLQDIYYDYLRRHPFNQN